MHETMNYKLLGEIGDQNHLKISKCFRCRLSLTLISGLEYLNKTDILSNYLFPYFSVSLAE